MALKQRIIDASYKLFSEKGFEKTTVSEIIELAGASKGGFYHHFKSKDDILETITLSYVDELVEYYHEMQKVHESSVIDLFNNVIITINQAKVQKMEQWPRIQRMYAFDGNHIFIRKMAEKFEAITTDLYTQVIRRGIDEGVFTCPYPQQLAGLWTREILRIYSRASALLCKNDPKAVKDFENLLDFSEGFINQSLGLADHTIAVKDTTLDYVEYSRKRYAEMFNKK